MINKINVPKPSAVGHRPASVPVGTRAVIGWRMGGTSVDPHNRVRATRVGRTR